MLLAGLLKLANMPAVQRLLMPIRANICRAAPIANAMHASGEQFYAS
jgi:hypothetical protein